MTNRWTHGLRLVLVLALALADVGCAAMMAAGRGRRLMEANQCAAAVEEYRVAVAARPEDAGYRERLKVAVDCAAQQERRGAEAAVVQCSLDEAVVGFGRSLNYQDSAEVRRKLALAIGEKERVAKVLAGVQAEVKGERWEAARDRLAPVAGCGATFAEIPALARRIEQKTTARQHGTQAAKLLKQGDPRGALDDYLAAQRIDGESAQWGDGVARSRRAVVATMRAEARAMATAHRSRAIEHYRKAAQFADDPTLRAECEHEADALIDGLVHKLWRHAELANKAGLPGAAWLMLKAADLAQDPQHKVDGPAKPNLEEAIRYPVVVEVAGTGDVTVARARLLAALGAGLPDSVTFEAPGSDLPGVARLRVELGTPQFVSTPSEEERQRKYVARREQRTSPIWSSTNQQLGQLEAQWAVLAERNKGVRARAAELKRQRDLAEAVLKKELGAFEKARGAETDKQSFKLEKMRGEEQRAHSRVLDLQRTAEGLRQRLALDPSNGALRSQQSATRDSINAAELEYSRLRGARETAARQLEQRREHPPSSPRVTKAQTAFDWADNEANQYEQQQVAPQALQLQQVEARIVETRERLAPMAQTVVQPVMATYSWIVRRLRVEGHARGRVVVTEHGASTPRLAAPLAEVEVVAEDTGSDAHHVTGDPGFEIAADPLVLPTERELSLALMTKLVDEAAAAARGMLSTHGDRFVAAARREEGDRRLNDLVLTCHANDVLSDPDDEQRAAAAILQMTGVDLNAGKIDLEVLDSIR